MGVGQFYDAVRMKQIEDTTVVAGFVDLDGHLLLSRRDGATIDAGDVRAPNLADASTTVKGIAQLATDAEAVSGLDDLKIITPKSLAAKVASIPPVPNATDVIPGIVELATSAETIAGADDTRAVTPAGLGTLTSTASRRGLVELATDAETRTGTDTDRAVSPARLTNLLRGGTQGRIPSAVVVSGGSATVASDGTVSFVNVASIALDGIFDGVGADFYIAEVWLQHVSGTAGGAAIQLRAGGTDQTTGYTRNAVYRYGNNSNAPTGDSGASTIVGYIAPQNLTGYVAAANISFLRPGTSDFTMIIAESGQFSANSSYWSERAVSPASTFDGFKILRLAGTALLSGYIKVVKIG